MERTFAVKDKVIDIACRMCDTMMRKFPEAKDLPPKKLFHYHQGVFLSGMLETYRLTGEVKYYDYIKSWVDSIIQPDGSIVKFDPTRLDDIQPGVLLFTLYNKTGDERYQKALDTLIGILRNWKKNKAGGFWHKDCHPNQMWLDSLYMAGPIQAEYASYSGELGFLNEAVRQALIMHEHMLKAENGLMYHAWDESKEETWADKETGLSPEVWGRAQGWYVLSVMILLEYVPQTHPDREKLEKIEEAMLKAVMKYRDEKTKQWYQVVDKGGCEGNWIETSCSCLFTAAIAKAVTEGFLGSEYCEYVNECFDAIYDSMGKRGDDILVSNVCIGTGVCDYEGYIERPTCENDLHGVGTFLLMCAEVAKMNEK